MSRVFVSYRRSDSITITGRIHDRLVAEFGEETIFKDVDDIPLGADFRKVLDNEVGQCAVQLVIIGSSWLTASHEGMRRLDNPDDFVRIEIESGLSRDEMVVVPVLVTGAGMPNSADLPESMRELVYHNAAIVRDDPDFHRDMSRLIAQIKQHLDTPASAPQKAVAPPTKRKEPKAPRQVPNVKAIPRTWIIAAVAILIIMIILVSVSRNNNTSDDGNIIDTLVLSGVDETLLIGVALDTGDSQLNDAILQGVELVQHVRPEIFIDSMAVSWEIFDSTNDCSEQDGISIFNDFAGEQRLVGVIGHACDENCRAVGPNYTDAGLTTISPACNDPDIMGEGDYASFSRTIPSDTTTIVSAGFIYNDLGHNSIVVVHDGDNVSSGQAQTFEESFESIGGEITDTLTISSDDIADVLDTINGYDNVTVVYYAGHVEYGAQLIVAEHGLWENGITFVLANGEDKHELASQIGGSGGSDIYTVYQDELETSTDFDASYETLYGEEPPVYAAYAYDAANMLLDAIDEVATINDDGIVEINRDNLWEYLQEYEGEGVLGALECSGNHGNCRSAAVTIFKMDESGEFSWAGGN
jgi:ABC-type branched-subunit amino acid transport system substrate-binding protein